jgi:hypothetical protein
MKLDGKMMVAVAMVAGALGAAGCSTTVTTDAQQDGASAQQETTAPQGESMTQAAADWFGAHVWSGPRFVRFAPEYRYGYGYRFAPMAPPVVRVEYPGVAPSARHFWVNGHWSYNGREYVWVGGHWDVRRDGYTYVQPHWDRVNGRWVYMGGHFARI